MLERLKTEVLTDFDRAVDDGVLLATLFSAGAVILSTVAFIGALALGEVTGLQTATEYAGTWLVGYTSTLRLLLWFIVFSAPIIHRHRGEALSHTVISLFTSAIVMLSTAGINRAVMQLIGYDKYIDASERTIDLLSKDLSALRDTDVIITAALLVATAITIAEVYPRVYGEFYSD